MNAIAKIDARSSASAVATGGVERPSRAEAEAAVRTLIRWAGDDPSREGLLNTPARVVRAYGDWFAGYGEDPGEHLARTFEELAGYDEMVVLRDIRFVSHCEHHLAPIVGRAHVAYVPCTKVVGLSKLARLVEVYAKRLQSQERMTAQIADALERALGPRGVAVLIVATHGCMTSRGVGQSAATTVTSRMLGAFRDHPDTRQAFLAAIGPRDPCRVGA